MEQSWFEMEDIKRKNYDKSVWIPLKAYEPLKKRGESGTDGYLEDYFGCSTIAVALDCLDRAKSITWNDLGLGVSNRGNVEDGAYIPSDMFIKYDDEDFVGVYLVLEQEPFDDSPKIWHLHQDLVVTLGLIREGNEWLCPRENYDIAARIKFDKDKHPISIEIKALYLKDYLCARRMVLCMSQYHSRTEVVETAPSFTWEESYITKNTNDYQWDGIIQEIAEGGMPFGESFYVMHVSRTDVEKTDDIPDLEAEPSNENITSTSWTKKFTGKKLYRVSGELWRTETLLPSAKSPIVKGDKVEATSSFIIDEMGNTVHGEKLGKTFSWLWFDARVVENLIQNRGGSLHFYTAMTGRVACAYGNSIHFGVNELGLVNVFAKDIGYLPQWQQKIWAAHNVAPDGGVSKELLASQVDANPAATEAPEMILPKAIKFLEELAQEKLNISIFRGHRDIPIILTRCHRFRATSDAKLLELAKDLNKVILEDLNTQAMQSIVKPPKGENWASRKSLENLFTNHCNYELETVRKVTAPLAGLYDLRHADAHLAKEDLEGAFTLMYIDRDKPLVHQGGQMIMVVAMTLVQICRMLDEWDEPKLS